MRKKEIKCPYCGSKAKLVHFYDIYGKDATAQDFHSAILM